MRLPAPVTLSKKDRQQLEGLVASRTLEQRLHERARVVLLAADGKNNQEIGEQLGIHYTTASEWRTRFNRDGFEGLVDKPRSGRPKSRSAEVERQIVALTSVPPPNATHWSVRRLAERVGVSPSTVHDVWRRHDLKPHKVRRFKLSNDPRFEEKVVDIVGLYLDPPERSLVL